MNRVTSSADPEEWMLMQQRHKQSRSQSLPQSALILEPGSRGPRILHNSKNSKKASGYITKIPHLIQLHQQNPLCVKLDCSDTLIESPSPELKLKTKGESDDVSPKTGSVETYDGEDLLNFKKYGEVRSTNMSTLQLPNADYHQRRRNSSPLSWKDVQLQKYIDKGRRNSNTCEPLSPLLKEGIEYLKISHKNIEAEKKKVESVLEKERRAMETKTSSNLMTTKHHIALSSTISAPLNLGQACGLPSSSSQHHSLAGRLSGGSGETKPSKITKMKKWIHTKLGDKTKTENEEELKTNEAVEAMNAMKHAADLIVKMDENLKEEEDILHERASRLRRQSADAFKLIDDVKKIQKSIESKVNAGDILDEESLEEEDADDSTMRQRHPELLENRGKVVEDEIVSDADNFHKLKNIKMPTDTENFSEDREDYDESEEEDIDKYFQCHSIVPSQPKRVQFSDDDNLSNPKRGKDQNIIARDEDDETCSSTKSFAENKETVDRNDQLAELKRELDLHTSGTEFEQGIIDGMEEVHECVEIENDESFIDTDDIKELITKKEYVLSSDDHNYSKNRKLSSNLDPSFGVDQLENEEAHMSLTTKAFTDLMKPDTLSDDDPGTNVDNVKNDSSI